VKTYDFSPDVSLFQRVLFGLWGVVQLFVGTVAFQRQGFVQGLGIMLFGMVAFCAALFVVFRFNRQRISVGDVAIVIEMGPARSRSVAWDHIEGIIRGENGFEIVLKSGDRLDLLGLNSPDGKGGAALDALWEQIRGYAIEQRISLEQM
tara:strand:+ start:1357 stop:1803 length:447 start_codon:yes stop_codon:yes gene_type:complete